MTRKGAVNEKEKDTSYQLYWFIHHNVLIELSTEPIENRLLHIRKWKPYREHRRRFRALKPVKRVDLLPGRIPLAMRHIRKLIEEFGATEIHLPYIAHGKLQEYGKLQEWITILYKSLNCDRHRKRLIARHRKEYPRHR